MCSWESIAETQPLAARIMMNSFHKNRVSHAYLLQGAPGTGKKSIATLLAMTLLCEEKVDVEPCGECIQCKRILSRNHPDVHWVEPDGESIKKDQIIELRKEFTFTAYERSKKVYIIVNAELMTTQSANRILKYLEEPDQDTTAILLTDNGYGLLDTIKSRCQIIDLKPLDQLAFQHKLIHSETNTITESNARLLSALTNNIDEASEFHEEEKVYQIRELVKDLIYALLTDHEARYLFLQQKWFPLLANRKDQELGLDILLLSLRDMLYFQVDLEDSMLFFHTGDGLLKRAVMGLSKEKLLLMIKAVLEAKQKLKQNIHPTLVMEQLVLKF